MPVAYISGHTDLTEAEFLLHYQPLINEAYLAGHHFVVGDAKGADYFAQEYLANYLVIPSRVVVYHMLTDPRHFYVSKSEDGHEFSTVGGFKSDEERDAAMTKASTYDIAWVRPGRENSGTARNLKRRLIVNKINNVKKHFIGGISLE